MDGYRYSVSALILISRSSKKIRMDVVIGKKSSLIISSILFHHNGPVHDFYLYVPDHADGAQTNLSQWISLLAKKGVQRITIDNSDGHIITSYIFWCSELVYLQLANFSLNPPRTCFHGFPKLMHLELLNVEFTKQNTFCSLIENCRMLVTLKLEDWLGMDHVVIDAPSLQTLVLNGDFESLAFRNVRSLKNVSLCLKKMPQKLITEVTVDSVNLLASSCQLQSIEFNGHLCKFLAAGDIMGTRPVTFNNLDKLHLCNLDLSDFAIFRYVMSMIECCPYIKNLDISVIPSKHVVQGIFDFNYNYKLDHLRKVNIKGITGSSVELKLVEYLLAISASLENLFFQTGRCENDSELKMSRALMRFRRASTKASLVCLE